MSLLLSPSRIKDLKVLYFLSITPRTSYIFIEEETGISTRTGKDIIKRINVAIEERFKISNYVVSNTKGEVYINSKYVIKKFEILYKLRLTWYKESLPLKLLNYLIENHQLSFIEVQNKLYISDSGLKKIILKINNYLKSFSFKIISSKGLLKFDCSYSTLYIVLILILNGHSALIYSLKRKKKFQLKNLEFYIIHIQEKVYLTLFLLF